MSSTFKLNASLVTDPRTAAWAAIASTVPAGGIGQPVQSNMRTCILEFPVLTAAQFAPWFAQCDVFGSGYVTAGIPAVYLPRRSDAAFATDPETAFYTTPNPLTSVAQSFYMLHLMGGSHSTGGKVYNLRIMVYMWVEIGTP